MSAIAPLQDALRRRRLQTFLAPDYDQPDRVYRARRVDAPGVVVFELCGADTWRSAVYADGAVSPTSTAVHGGAGAVDRAVAAVAYYLALSRAPQPIELHGLRDVQLTATYRGTGAEIAVDWPTGHTVGEFHEDELLRLAAWITDTFGPHDGPTEPTPDATEHP